MSNLIRNCEHALPEVRYADPLPFVTNEQLQRIRAMAELHARWSNDVGRFTNVADFSRRARQLGLSLEELKEWECPTALTIGQFQVRFPN